jgi:L-Lysine epsilon oxidase N-terminal/L-lysine epsilon oxidase C-terminal domain/von Willebrand factor type A domain
MATTYSIHPAIGIARVGNSPDEWFIGPERVGELPDPPGGFKDDQCRVKRQAARFRVFAHHDDGSVDEVTDAEAEIEWTVHLANAKAAYPGRGNTESAADLTIDAGPRTTTGPDQHREFDTGSIHFSGTSAVTVPLGEMRTDDDNHLIVLGGRGRSASPDGSGMGDFWGNPGWYDDVADGPVSASITLRATGATPAVAGAWVIVAPPKFAPQQDSVTTLYDRVLQRMVDLGLVGAPTTTSYTDDVYPILKRAHDMRWVEGILGSHAWSHPVYAQATVDAVMSRVGGSDMPRLNGSDHALTPIQLAHLQRWQSGAYTQDWAGPPAAETAVTPDGLTRAALEACVGAAFFPGIEAGGKSAGNRPILEATYTAAFRLDHASTGPGAVSASMALPWQADFYACGDYWWPVPRPNDVLPLGSSTTVRFSRDVGSYQDMVDKWHTLGFVVAQGGEHVEVQHCDESSVTLTTPHLDFADVPQGPMGMVREMPLAITFEVVSTGSAVTLEYTPTGGPTHPQLVAVTSSVTVGPTTGTAVAEARLWLVYRTGSAPSSVPTQTLTVRETVSGRTWTVTVDANTVARRTTSVALVLDRSGSMAEDAGGPTKHQALQQAATTFVGLMLSGDGAGVVRYNQDAQELQPVVALGDGMLTDTGRTAVLDAVNGPGLDPQGATSIGDGIATGRTTLGAATGYDGKALVVLTDGVENSPQWISDVASSIDASTYAIGLGTPQNTSAAALQTVSGNNGGYLLVTGPVTGDNRFLLQKYFLQVLAGVSNAEVVLDPDGVLVPGRVERVPFVVSDADSGIDVVLLTPRTDVVDFRLQTPTGQIIEPWRARSEATMRHERFDGTSYYRLTLPAQLVSGRFDHAGTWHALLTLGTPRDERSDTESGADLSIVRGRREPVATPVVDRRGRLVEHERSFAVALEAGREAAAATSVHRRSIPYSLVVHAYSGVSMDAEVRQQSLDPGARVTVSARVTESGLPADAVSVWAEVTRPDGGTDRVDLAPAHDRHEGAFTATAVGTHRVRVRARGRTRRGNPFTRERLLTASVWLGGDRDAATWTRHDDPRAGGDLCRILDCLLGDGGGGDGRLDEVMERFGIDLRTVRKCLESRCSEGGSHRDDR